jgi:hypothetical protein
MNNAMCHIAMQHIQAGKYTPKTKTKVVANRKQTMLQNKNVAK